MALLAKIKALSGIVSAAKGVKGMIFADGKFKPERAAMLGCVLVILLVAMNFMEYEEVASAVQLLDEVSDVVGYQE